MNRRQAILLLCMMVLAGPLRGQGPEVVEGGLQQAVEPAAEGEAQADSGGADSVRLTAMVAALGDAKWAVSYTHLTLPTN